MTEEEYKDYRAVVIRLSQMTGFTYGQLDAEIQKVLGQQESITREEVEAMAKEIAYQDRGCQITLPAKPIPREPDPARAKQKIEMVNFNLVNKAHILPKRCKQNFMDESCMTSAEIAKLNQVRQQRLLLFKANIGQQFTIKGSTYQDTITGVDFDQVAVDGERSGAWHVDDCILSAENFPPILPGV